MRSHGKQSTYAAGCRCEKCKKAHAASSKKGNRAAQARRLAAGLDTSGRPRKTPYDERALALMREHGLKPDPRFVWRSPGE